MRNFNLLVAFLAILLYTSCEKTILINELNFIPITQFGDSVIEFSSEYRASPGSWSAIQATGSPDTYPEYGDKVTAWASQFSDSSDEFISIAFDTIQYVEQINIYETYNPGAVTAVSLRDASNGNWVPVYIGDVELDLPSESRIMVINIERTSFEADAVKLDIASTQVSGWNEIDAVAIIGAYEKN